MTDHLAILASIDKIVTDVLISNISDDDLSDYISYYVSSELSFPQEHDREAYISFFKEALPVTLYKIPLDDIAEKDIHGAYAMVTDTLNNAILRAVPIPTDRKQSYPIEIYDTILSYIEYVLRPKWPYLSRDMRAVYIFLLYGGLSSVELPSSKLSDRRKEALVTEALLDLDGGNILYPPTEYGLSELTSPRLAVMIENYLTPPPLNLVRERIARRLLPYT